MTHRSRWLLVLVTLGMLLAGCGETTRNGEAAGNAVTTIPPTDTTAGAADIASLPAAAAPNGLGAATLPADARGIAALLARLPSTVAGQPRTPQRDQAGPERYSVTYGDGRAGGRHYRVQALDVSTGDFFQPGSTAGDVVALRAAKRGEPQDIDTIVAAGREGSLVWMQERTTVTDEGKTSPLLATSWGTASSAWLFGAQADTPEAAEALVGAFIAAAKG